MEEENTSDSQLPTQPDRLAAPVDTEQPPRLPFPVVGIGASAGGLEAVTELLAAVRADSGMAYVFIQHLPPTGESLLAEILSKRASIPVHEIDHEMLIEQDHLYCARPGRTLVIKDGKFHLGEYLGRPMNNRPVDDFFRSLAEEQRERAIAIILSGMGSNGTAGTQAIKAVGGLCIAQETETAQYPSMPRHLIDAGYADYILRPSDMPDVLLAYAGHPYAKGGREEKADLAKRDEQHLREILAVLRTRTRQDFNGYKKPTVLRRVQRRMGINRVAKLSDYSKLLRQNPMEVSALSDDLLIHVTGFFRDGEAWEALRKEVTVPLVAARDADTSVRCWVTACSSGEEAYSLAMLLVEEAERINKTLDIKVFATDMADRTLQNARAGIYPGGIESEIEPARLERFFQKEDAVYRIRQDLRELVVFAPQNLLHDPPFSRLDIATCRNLLIYLEPAMQQRVIGLLHFGLREGGTLFLGTSETVGVDDLFQVINKKARIYRRIGPTRHSAVEFPLPHRLIAPGLNEHTPDEPRVTIPRASIAQLTARALLEHHTPAAVTIDRDYRIVYFHGNVDPYITSPRGEPTRNLMELAREDIRGTVRTAVHRAISANSPVMLQDGFRESVDGPRTRIQIFASPLERGKQSDSLVVSFHERPDPVSEERSGASDASHADTAEELLRIRDELQSTIEELQTSNEELKASHEEVVSTNEELQSSNEELETSREEMQSLNEELSTVNSQLHARMEEHQSSSNDLASLLSSTDIAVLFLDPQLRIRRFTAAMRRLMELIPADIGRPINNMARKFDDVALLPDLQSVLDDLVPVEKEIIAEDGRCYLRRVLPYRTIDNHIDGVVVTFLDISDRKHNEIVLRESRIWLMGQKEAFQAAISGRAIAESLGVLVRTAVEQIGEDARAAFYILKPGEKALTHVVGMPESYAKAIDGFVVGQESVASGLAMHAGEPVITEDVETEPRWAPWVALSREYDYRGCWSFPVQIEGGPALGTFALYFRQPRKPTERELELAGMMAHAAAIIISRHNEAAERATVAAALRESEQQLTQSKRHTDAALLAADMATYWWDVASDRLTGDQNFVAIADGLADETNSMPMSAFLQLIHPDELPGVQSAINATLTENVPFSVEFRLASRQSGEKTNGRTIKARAQGNRKDVSEKETRVSGIETGDSENGSYRWFAARGTVDRNAAGRPVIWVGALVDITGLKQVEDSLRTSEDQQARLRGAAEETNRLKDQFLATLSHELRTPLSSILLWVRLLQNQPKPDDMTEGLLAIQTSAEAQKSLIDDLLDMSRITNMSLRLQRKQIDLSHLLRESINAVARAGNEKEIQIIQRIDDTVGTVFADGDRMRQVIWNLLTNAIKFTPRGGKIQVNARRVDGSVEIRVQDTGMGIPVEFQPHLFKAFRQADSSHSRTTGGLGLGLAIVKQLVELHGGTIHAHSAGVKKGTTFTIQLPLLQLPSDKPVEQDEAILPEAPTDAAKSLTGLMVLLVEDDKPTRTAIAEVVSRAGMRVVQAENADQALAVVNESNPDLILSDIGLPGRDGYALMQGIRKLESDQKREPTPAIALTAFASDADRRKAMDAGFQMHLGKPVNPDQILSTIAKLVNAQSA